MNQGTQFATKDGTVLHVTSDEHAGDTVIVAVGDVLTVKDGDGATYTVAADGEAVTLIADGAPEGSGQTVFLQPATRTSSRATRADVTVAPSA